MTTSEKPTLHLEGQVLEAEVQQWESTEYRRIKIDRQWLSCWEPTLYPLMVKGKYLAVDYTATKPQQGKRPRLNIQQAGEMAAPQPSPRASPEVPAPWEQRQNAAEAGKQAGVAMRYAVDLIVAGKVEIGELEAVATRIHRAMEALQTGEAALPTGEQASNLPPAGNAPSSAVPTTQTRTPIARPGAASPTTIPEFKNLGEFGNWTLKTFGKTLDAARTEFGAHGMVLAPTKEAAEKLLEWWGPKGG